MGAADIPLAAKHKQHPHQQRANTTSQFDASKSASGGLPLNSVPAVGETTNPPSMKITNPCTGISAESEKASGVT